MFTGIVEAMAILEKAEQEGRNLHLTLRTPLSAHFSIDQSIAHDGICLTVVAIEGETYQVTAIAETISKTTVGNWQAGKSVNIERALVAGSRLDGHMVQGHVDGMALLQRREGKEGSHVLTFSIDKAFAPYLIEKGSVCVNGVSLTCFDVKDASFSVAIIPYTWQHTNLSHLTIHDAVNMEYDMMGKYFARWMALKNL